ncbi:major facilitator superfamily domain-containing protein 4B-like [Oppia nitens]|uniref:major facilitator superfamily domain-containing protein 4B-like n=1 Tax=Oppia nitens TaxID=1686743 RepID=UPI0023DCA372|nr:major facilitator superfamily domain-containing protein 4B-like [Oppia nitens]
MPYVGLYGYYVTFTINGLASGVVDTLSTVWIVEMWTDMCGPFAQGLQFALGSAAIISPIVANRFLSETVIEFVHHINQQSNYTVNSFINNRTIVTGNVVENITLVNSTTIAITERTPTRIHIPYLFIGGLNCLSAIIVGCLYLYKPYVNRTIQSDTDNIITNKPDGSKLAKQFANIKSMLATELRPTCPILVLLILSANMIGLVTTIMWTYANYWLSFAQSSQGRLTNQLANNIMIAMWSSFSLSRAICVVLSYYVKPIPVTYVCLVILLVSQILFLIFQGTSIAIMWTGSALIGFGLGPIFANIYQLIESITPVTNLVGALFIFTIGVYYGTIGGTTRKCLPREFPGNREYKELME